MDYGLIGGIVGSLLGLAGGAYGTWASITNTNGPKERAFMTRISIWLWVGIMLFLAFIFLLPPEQEIFLWLLYAPALVLVIRYTNKRQAEIRASEHPQP